MKTTTITTADGREIRVIRADDWEGLATLVAAGDVSSDGAGIGRTLPGWVARELCRGAESRSAIDDAADAIAKLCDCDSWDYPGQLVRWVTDLKSQRAAALARAEQAERERDEARDCGQADVCAIAPGCQRHWEARNRDLVRDRDEARAEVRQLQREYRCAHCYSELAELRLRDATIPGLLDERDALRARLDKAEKVVEAARRWRVARAACLGIKDAADALAAALRALDEDSPRAIVDSDTAAVGAVDSTPGLSRLASAEPGDAGSSPARSGCSGTPGLTAGAIPAARALDPEAPATRAEVEELRRRIERLENPK